MTAVTLTAERRTDVDHHSARGRHPGTRSGDPPGQPREATPSPSVVPGATCPTCTAHLVATPLAGPAAPYYCPGCDRSLTCGDL